MRDWEPLAWKIGLILLAPAMILCVLFIIVSPFLLLHAFLYPSKTIELEVAKWVCVSTYKERVFTGKTWTTETRCGMYHRRGLDSDMKSGEKE